MQCMLHEAMCNDGVHKRNQKLCEGKDTMKNIEDARRLTSGVVVANRKHALDESMYKIVKKNEKTKAAEANCKALKKSVKLRQQILAIVNI